MLHWSRLIDQCHAAAPFSGLNGRSKTRKMQWLMLSGQTLAFTISSNTWHDVITLKTVIFRSHSKGWVNGWIIHRANCLKLKNKQSYPDTDSSILQTDKGLVTWSPQINEWAKSIPMKSFFRHDSFIVMLIWCVFVALLGVHFSSNRSTSLPLSSSQYGIWRP